MFSLEYNYQRGDCMITKIKNGKLILNHGIEENKNLYFKDNVICEISEADLPFDKEIDACGKYVSPGFIDIHTHGGGGYDFMDGGTTPILEAAKLHLSYGTTTILPTSLACSHESLLAFLEDLNTIIKNNLSESRILGAHLEGPYFSLAQSGAQNPQFITPPIKKDYEEIIEKYNDIVLRWSFAPELEGAEEFCTKLIKSNINPSIAHSDAQLKHVKKVYDLGCSTFTHLYSGMSSIVREMGYRKLGVIESAYLLDNTTVEVIADGYHLPPELLMLIVKNIGPEHICLVTDSMRGAGMPNGKSQLGKIGEGLECIIEDGVAKLLDKSAFAGSVATSDRLVRTMVKEAGCSIFDAVKMITQNPAKLLNRTDIGVLEKGAFADIVIFDDDIKIGTVIANGNII